MAIYFIYSFYYRPQRIWGKVIFSQACVILFTGGVCLSACWDTRPPPGPDPPGPGTTPPDQTPPPGAGTTQCTACWEIRSTSGWYASYWNAILLLYILIYVILFSVLRVGFSSLFSFHLVKTKPSKKKVSLAKTIQEVFVYFCQFFTNLQVEKIYYRKLVLITNSK